MLAAAAQSSLTALTAELEGRPLGGGLLKLEPSAAQSLLLPIPADHRAAAAGDFAFHFYLVGILKNRQLMDVYRIMKPVMLKIMENGVAKRKQGWDNFVEHGAIIDALEARNRIAFKFEMSRHLEAGLARGKVVVAPDHL